MSLFHIHSRVRFTLNHIFKTKVQVITTGYSRLLATLFMKSKICDRASVYHIKACAIVKKLTVIGELIEDHRKETF